MKLWGGRFQKDSDSVFEAFGRSLESDARLVRQDLRVCRAHVVMLSEQSILESKDSKALLEALDELLNGEIQVEGSDEDVHSWVERQLQLKLGPLASSLRLGRSRNDLVATDFRLYIREACQEIQDLIRQLQATVVNRCEEIGDIPLPGYTHLQRAQPVLLGHHLMAHFWALDRDVKRFRQCAEEADCCVLGSGALAGTTWPIDPRVTARELGFSRVADNSLDAVSDRDFALEFLFACATCAIHLSRIAEELILWSSSEFSFCRFDDAWSTGSSLMPQKKNPDPAELIRGKTGLFLGNLVDLLTTLKALPLAYNRDLQQDKPPVFRSHDELCGCLAVLCGTLKTLNFRREQMELAVSDESLLVTDLADELVRQGLSFGESHELAGRSLESQDKLDESELRLLQKAWSEVDLEKALSRRSHHAAAGHASLKRQLEKAKKILI